MRQIIILEKEGDKETWGAITDICKAHEDINYHSIKNRKFPFKYKGYTFTKSNYKEKIIC